MKGNSKRTSGNSLSPLVVQNKDLCAASQTVLIRVLLSSARRLGNQLWKPEMSAVFLQCRRLVSVLFTLNMFEPLCEANLDTEKQAITRLRKAFLVNTK